MTIPPHLVGPLLDDLLDRRRDEREAYEILDRLTPREREVLLFLGSGANNRTIAHELRISEGPRGPMCRTSSVSSRSSGRTQPPSSDGATCFGVVRSDSKAVRVARALSIGSLAAADHEGDVVALVGSVRPWPPPTEAPHPHDTQQEGSLTV